ncbi:hypothetical protein, partial [Stenotrophomonas maltophilia]|uniref:hypothetical protein n=1 Tax=Stenotrophomonas maltophilia TaxID=40324 RepID=UPI001952BDCE
DWRDLYLAVIVHQVLVRKNKPAGAVSQVGRWIRLLAACSSGTPPWAIDSDQVRLGYNAALLLGGSGKLASN